MFIQKDHANKIILYSTYKTLVLFKRKKTHIFTSPSDTSVKTYNFKYKYINFTLVTVLFLPKLVCKLQKRLQEMEGGRHNAYHTIYS